ncbi:MAG: hypothetical protein ACI87W_000336 [Halieaceae bacterium]
MALTEDLNTETNSAQAAQGGRFFAMNPGQIIKIVVYSLLLVNFVHYIGNDLAIARYTMHDGWTLKDWTGAFATTLDESAWFLLLLLLELETYALSDEAFTPTRVRIMQGLRIVCYLAIGHTVFAFADTLVELSNAVEHSGVGLCSFADSGLSFARNLDYQDLDASNCETLSAATHFYQFAQNQALTDAAGMRIEWALAWVDLIEVVVWLLILIMIEGTVRLQEQRVTGGSFLHFTRVFKTLLYATLWAAAGYWIHRGHWIFAWDEALWILGFMAIGMNLAEWRKEIDAEDMHRAND